MRKYIAIFRLSLQQEFAYKLNFVMWRVRNITQILVFFFLWDAALSGAKTEVLGYTKEKIFAYAFLLIVVRALVLSSRSVDAAGQISNGDITNLLLRPINYFKFWLTRDISSKVLNLLFAAAEIFLLFMILKPEIFMQTDVVYWLLSLLSLIFAGFLFFNILMITNSVPFWAPETAWGAQFLVIVVIVEFLSGAFFPIDIFPKAVYEFLSLTPFPYLVFFPISIFLGNLNYLQSMQSLLISGLWCFVLWKLSNYVFKRGLMVYDPSGK